MSTAFCKRFIFLSLMSLIAIAVMVGCSSDDATTQNGNNQGNGSGEAFVPTQPIEYIAPANAGGGWDTIARTSARVLEQTGLIPVRLPVDNMPGGGGAVGWAYMASHAGDPHKLFVTSPPIILVPLNGNSDYNHTDFTPIARLITDYMIVGVRADSPYQTIEELMEALKNNPESIAIAGGSAPGSMDHIAIAGAANAAGVNAKDVNYVAFSGGGEAMTALLGGHVDVVSTGVGESSALVQAGEIRILAISAPERLDIYPDVPTYLDAGIDFTFDVWRGVMAPPGIADDVKAYYEKVFYDMLQTDTWAEARDDLGWTDAYLNSADFGAFLDEQYALFENILSEIGIID